MERKPGRASPAPASDSPRASTSGSASKRSSTWRPTSAWPPTEGATGVEDAGELVEEWLRAVGEGVPGYVTPKVAVGAAVGNDEGELLLVKRADSGVWLYPTGWADVGYSAAEVVVKEVLEETGIEAEPLRLIAVLDGLRLGFTRVPLYSLVFHCRAMGGDASAPSPRMRRRGLVRRGQAPPAPGRGRALGPARVRGAARRTSRRPVRPSPATHVAGRSADGLTRARASAELRARRARARPVPRCRTGTRRHAPSRGTGAGPGAARA